MVDAVFRRRVDRMVKAGYLREFSDRQLGITCDHVFQGYLDDRQTHPDGECQFGNNTIDPESRLIARSPLIGGVSRHRREAVEGRASGPT